jgi:hypothetical protein
LEITFRNFLNSQSIHHRDCYPNNIIQHRTIRVGLAYDHKTFDRADHKPDQGEGTPLQPDVALALFTDDQSMFSLLHHRQFWLLTRCGIRVIPPDLDGGIIENETASSIR